MNNLDAHSRSLRKHRIQDRPATYFITKNTHPRKPALTVPLRRSICEAFRFAVEGDRIVLRAFVVMPDHWHALLALHDDWTLSRFIHAFMSHVGKITNTHFSQMGTDWQEGYYETRIRSLKQFRFVEHYILNNPVTKGLAATPEEWDATSLRFPSLVSESWPWRFEKE